MYLLYRWIISALLLLGIAYLIPAISVSGIYIALITAVLLGLANAVIKPILMFFTLPLNILTLGLFTFLINGFLFWFVSTVVGGFTVEGFWPAVLGALILSLGNWLFVTILELN